ASMKLGRIPPASSPIVRRVMKANKARDTGPELRLRGGLAQRRCRGYKTNMRLGKTRVDIAFPSQKVAVLVHGCFWHHCSTCNPGYPKSNRSYWKRHFAINRLRDERVRNQLSVDGWKVIEIWEHE